jgi:hypothetical protein
MNLFDHKDLGNHLLQLCPKVVKQTETSSGRLITACSSVSEKEIPKYNTSLEAVVDNVATY